MKLFYVLFFPILTFAQENSLRFALCINNIDIELGNTYNTGKRNITVENLKFYISNLSLFQKNKLVYKDSASARLLDLDNPKSLTIKLNKIKKFDRIIFNLGIDSTTNISGALGGDLDPTKGMYWTWQSGYINFKLEGTDPRCNSRHHRFQYHLGGYAFPFATIQQVELKLTKKLSKAIIVLPLENFLKAINPEKKPMVMSPCKEAVELSKLLSNLFEIRS